MKDIFSRETAELIKVALAEDIGAGDFSTVWSVPKNHKSRARIISRQEGIIAGIPVIAEIIRISGENVEMIASVSDGYEIQPDEIIVELEGGTHSLLKLERTILNFIQRISAVATLTRRFADQVEGSGAKILDTRKTTPGMRRLEKYAVRVGGGVNHRVGLFDYVLLKENHVAAAGGIKQAVDAVRRNNDRGLSVEVEVSRIEEVHEALAAVVDRIMLDNMSIDQMKTAVEHIRAFDGKVPEIEASGDVNIDNVSLVAGTGVDYISVGALTHSAGILNLSMLIEPVNQ